MRKETNHEKATVTEQGCPREMVTGLTEVLAGVGHLLRAEVHANLGPGLGAAVCVDPVMGASMPAEPRGSTRRCTQRVRPR
jgi:hypothetical protein